MRLDKLLGTLRHPVTAISVTWAKEKYIKDHPKCAVTGLTRDPRSGKRCEVHHIEPVHINPARATDPSNFITLLPAMHFWVGHCCNWKRWNAHVVLTAVALRDVRRGTVMSMRDKDAERWRSA